MEADRRLLTNQQESASETSDTNSYKLDANTNEQTQKWKWIYKHPNNHIQTTKHCEIEMHLRSQHQHNTQQSRWNMLDETFSLHTDSLNTTSFK